jgi:hypothetical protein
MKRSAVNHRSRRRQRALALAALVFLVPVLLVVYRTGSPDPKEDDTADAPTAAEPPIAAVPDPSPSSTGPPSTAPAGPGPAPTAVQGPRLVDEATMLEALKEWIQRRDGTEVEIVQSERNHDPAGTPISLSVLVTRLPGGLTADQLKERLSGLASSESELRQQLEAAYHQQNTQAVNRLAAQFSHARSVFIETNQVSAYKLSLTRAEPPILAFWDGLDYETAREPEARQIAVRTLGDTTALHSRLAYTSVAALLRFTNDIGAEVYVDPVRLATVPPDLVAMLPSASRPPADDPERDARVARQWLEMLGPNVATGNRP